MSDPLRVACVQLTSTTDVSENIRISTELVREAQAQGAMLVGLPEVVNLVQRSRRKSAEVVNLEGEDPALAAYQALAEELGIWLLAGSRVVRIADDDRYANRSSLISPEGRVVAAYDKIHMFDVDLEGGESFRESKAFRPGGDSVLARTPFGMLGLTICYDVRFPHLYRKLAQAGAEILFVPSAFTRQTGRAHWHILLRARAIETGCFVVAPAQCGDHEDGRETYGHSLVVSPWGEVLADGGETPGVVMAELDLSQVAKARRMIPALHHDRDFTPPVEVTPCQQPKG